MGVHQNYPVGVEDLAERKILEQEVSETVGEVEGHQTNLVVQREEPEK